VQRFRYSFAPKNEARVFARFTVFEECFRQQQLIRLAQKFEYKLECGQYAKA
jgi:hypothetical protein